jgi:cell division protein FtsQ
MDADAYPQEVLADEEPRYLRRQKPVEIKRRKFGKQAFRTYFRVLLLGIAAAAGAALLYAVGDFLFTSPRMSLVHPEQIELTGNHYVSRASVFEVFRPDRRKSVLRIPLEQRRRQLEAIPWVEQATVRRALPNHIQVEIFERTPVAFLRGGAELSLVDANGVVLERPLEGDFHFPVVAGISTNMPREERERRMKMFVDFMQQIDLARPGSSEHVSEVDLAKASDLRATLEGLPPAGGAVAATAAPAGPLVVHFGDRDFESKFKLLLENVGQWQAAAGRVESVDLRFSRQVVVNPDTAASAVKTEPPKSEGKQTMTAKKKPDAKSADRVKRAKQQ